MNSPLTSMMHAGGGPITTQISTASSAAAAARRYHDDSRWQLQQAIKRRRAARVNTTDARAVRRINWLGKRQKERKRADAEAIAANGQELSVEYRKVWLHQLVRLSFAVYPNSSWTRLSAANFHTVRKLQT